MTMGLACSKPSCTALIPPAKHVLSSRMQGKSGSAGGAHLVKGMLSSAAALLELSSLLGHELCEAPCPGCWTLIKTGIVLITFPAAICTLLVINLCMSACKS